MTKVELVVKLCVHVSKGIEVKDDHLVSEDDSISTRLTLIKLVSESCYKLNYRPKALKTLTNKCLKCYRVSSRCGGTDSNGIDTLTSGIDTITGGGAGKVTSSDGINIKVVVAAANASLGLVRLFQDPKSMDSLLSIAVDNLSSV